MPMDAIREAMATVRKHCELPANQRLFADNEAAWTLARWLVEHAGELVRVKGLEWGEVNYHSWKATSPFGEIQVWDSDLGYHWRVLEEDNRVVVAAKRCDSLVDGKAKAEAWYCDRLAAALEPLFGEGGK